LVRTCVGLKPQYASRHDSHRHLHEKVLLSLTDHCSESEMQLIWLLKRGGRGTVLCRRCN
jgi:hypothetical protein